MLVIGCGNPERGDDAAGILAAQRLRELGVPAQTSSGEASALIEAWEGEDEVMVIDAVVTGACPGTLHVWDGSQTLPSCLPLTSTHGLGVGEAIALSRALDRLPRRLKVWGIEAGQFEPGSEILPAVRRAVEQVAQEIAARANPGEGSLVGARDR